MKDTSRLPSIYCGTHLVLLKDWNRRITHICYERGRHRMLQTYCAGRQSGNTDRQSPVRAYSLTHLAPAEFAFEASWPVDIAISCPDCLAIYQDHMQDYKQL